MKPRNKDEREVCQLRGQLPAPTFEQVNWMVGQDYERLVEEFAEKKKKVEHWEYFSVVSAVEDWQVARYFLVSSKMTRKGYTFNYISEVSQRWMRIDENKRMQLHIFEKPKHMNWQWHNQPYSLDSPLSLKTWNTCSWNRGGRTEFFLADYEVCPYRQFAKCFVDSGLDKAVGRIDEICLYINRNLANRIDSVELSQEGVRKLTKRCYLPVMYETLMKIGEAKLANAFLNRGVLSEYISRYWHSFLIARRHGLRLDDWEMWFDYVKDLERLGRDIRSPKYLVPEDLGVAHGNVLRKLTEIREKLEWEDVIKEIAKYEPIYAKKKAIFFGITFKTRSGLTISTATSVRDIYDEGKAMHHCVYRMGYYKHAEDLILFARGLNGERVETCRIDLDHLKIAESRGLQNKATEWHDEIVEALNENMWRVADAMKKAEEMKKAA